MVAVAPAKPISLPPARKAALRTHFAEFFERGRPKVIRNHVEFAEQAIRVDDTGIKAGGCFSFDTQPFSRVVLQEFDDPRWTRHVGYGCVQSGKTLLYLVIPAARHLFEIGENFGVGVPQMEVAADKWRDEFFGTFSRSFPKLLPSWGAGSRGGKKFEAVTFSNGRTLKFLSGQGKSEKRSGITLKAISVTEADKVDRPPLKSSDPNPIGEIEGRLASFGDDGRFWGECTVTTKKGWVYREWKAGSQGEINKPCPHCNEFVVPGREHLVGWQDAADEIEARNNAMWCCPNCGEEITEQQRRDMCKLSILVHRGQKAVMGSDGVGLLEGPLPPTTTCAIRWSAFDNMFWTTEFIAAKNWRAAHPTDDQDEESTEKWVSQYMWAEPWEPDVWEETPLHVKEVRARMVYPRHSIPEETFYFAGGVDLGKYYGHYALPVGRSERRINVVDYDTFDVPSSSIGEHEGVYRALCELAERVIEPGFVNEQGQRFVPGAIFIDSNYQRDAVFRFIREKWAQGQTRYLPVLGVGISQMDTRGVYRHPIDDNGGEKVGHQWYVEDLGNEGVKRAVINVDEYKSIVRMANALEVGKPGSMAFFAASPNFHTTISKHIVSEFELLEYRKDKGVVKRHVNQARRPNHYFDALVYAFAALNACGLRFDDFIEFVAPTKEKHSPPPLLMPDGQPFLPVNPGIYEV